VGQEHQVQSRGFSPYGEWSICASARILDRAIDHELWDQLAALANRKYGWGDGLPIEITPLVT
jgi:hypothetical protein